jgi:hypothetical protein
VKTGERVDKKGRKNSREEEKLIVVQEKEGD